MSTQPILLVGEQIRGYQLEEVLEHGPITTLYRASTQELWQLPEICVNVVRMLTTLPHQTKMLFYTHFSHSAKRLTQLRHPHLFPLYGSGIHRMQDEYPYLLMPLPDGQRLALRQQAQQRWSPEEVLALLTPLVSALEYLHSKGFVYQFLSPESILLHPTMGTQLVCADAMRLFIAPNSESPQRRTPSSYIQGINGVFLGKLEFIAPEIFEGKTRDTRADIYSLGMLLLTLLSGQSLSPGETTLKIGRTQSNALLSAAYELSSRLPSALTLVINRALHRNPDLRFQKPKDLLDAYQRVIQTRLKARREQSLTTLLRRIHALPLHITPTRNGTSLWPTSILSSASSHHPIAPTEESMKTSPSAPHQGQAKQRTHESLQTQNRLASMTEPSSLANLSSEIEQLLRAISPVLDGDLRVQAPMTPDIVGALADQYNFLLEEAVLLIQQQRSLANHVIGTANEVLESFTELARMADQVMSRIEQVMLLFEQIVLTLQRGGELLQTVQGDSKSQVLDGVITFMHNSTSLAENQVTAFYDLQESGTEWGERILGSAERVSRLSLLASQAQSELQQFRVEEQVKEPGENTTP